MWTRWPLAIQSSWTRQGLHIHWTNTCHLTHLTPGYTWFVGVAWVAWVAWFVGVGWSWCHVVYGSGFSAWQELPKGRRKKSPFQVGVVWWCSDVMGLTWSHHVSSFQGGFQVDLGLCVVMVRENHYICQPADASGAETHENLQFARCCQSVFGAESQPVALPLWIKLITGTCGVGCRGRGLATAGRSSNEVVIMSSNIQEVICLRKHQPDGFRDIQFQSNTISTSQNGWLGPICLICRPKKQLICRWLLKLVLSFCGSEPMRLVTFLGLAFGPPRSGGGDSLACAKAIAGSLNIWAATWN